MFRNISINEKLWSFELGDCKVVNINRENGYFTATNGIENYCYKFDGVHGYNVRPTIFWSEPKFKIPEKPFDLKEFLKENLEPKEFIMNENNYFLYWKNEDKKFDYAYKTDYEDFKQYFKEKNIVTVVETLNEEKITKEQLRQTFKELGWM